jgi:hypothetical protein
VTVARKKAKTGADEVAPQRERDEAARLARARQRDALIAR